MSVRIVFETHSWSEDNERSVASGWSDGPLSARGRAAARELGERRRAEPVAAVFASDLRRSVESAEIAFEGSGIPIHRDALLRECNYGDLNGQPVADFDDIRPAHVDDPYLGGESYRQVVERVQDFLNDVSSNWQGARVVAIGHTATRWALDLLLAGRALEDLVAAPFDWQEGWEYELP